jgi:hypothetical protein
MQIRREGKAMEGLGPGSILETLLKCPEDLFVEIKGKRVAEVTRKLLALGLLCYLIYGCLIGSFSGGMQWWAAPVKAAGGMLFSALICLPSLYIFGCLARSESSLQHCVALLSGLVALSGVLLIGFLPVGWVFSTSSETLRFMGFLHLLFWWITLLFGAGFLRAGIQALGSETTLPIRIWSFMFILVCFQMTTTLRPLIGPGYRFFPEEKRFFLSHWATGIEDGAPLPSRSSRSPENRVEDE